MAENTTCSNADLFSLIQRMNSRFDDTIAQINQSVEAQLHSGLSEIHQRLDTELGAVQRQLRLSDKDPTHSAEPERRLASAVTEETPTPAETEKRSWADIMSEEEGELSDEEPVRSKKPKTVPVSEETKKLVKESFTKALSNSERKGIREKSSTLELPQTRCPKLDSLFKTQESKFTASSEAKHVDNDLRKIQALMLDVSAPLLELSGSSLRSQGGVRGCHLVVGEHYGADVYNKVEEDPGSMQPGHPGPG